MGELRISLLGPFRASVGERPLGPFRTSKVQALLIYLVVEAMSEPVVPHPREVLMDLLWPDLPLGSARDNLRQTLYQLRKAIPVITAEDDEQPIELIQSSRLSISLNPEYDYSLDVADFSRYLILDRLEEAVALYRDDFLADFFLPDSSEFESWATALRSKFQRQVLHALDRLVVQSLEQCWLGHAERYARRLLEIDDLQERAYRYLMEVLARLGQRSAALEVYDICQRRLGDELGIDPGRDTEALYQLVEADQIQVGGLENRKAIIKTELLVEGRKTSQEEIGDDGEDTLPVFVERKRELADLAQALEACRAGHGQLRFVIGGAGRGKTALVAEFARRALSAYPELLVTAGYCYGQSGYGDLYTPFREVLAQLTGEIVGVVFSQEQARRLKSAMPSTIPPLLTRAPDLIDSLIPGDNLRKRAASFAVLGSDWFQQLCARLEAPYRGSLRQDRLFGQIAALLEFVADKYPLLIILEDLHLADPTSVALLSQLSQALAKIRIFLIGTYRPEELYPTAATAEPPLAAIIGEFKRRHGDVWIDLGEMLESEGRSFIDAYLNTEPNHLGEPFRKALFNHTGGHALFTVELLRAMQERGDLFLDLDGRWQADGEIDWQILPAKVEGVIEQRLSRLDKDLQSALRVASVEGEVFTAEVVAKIQGNELSGMVRRLSTEVGQEHRLVQDETLGRTGVQRVSRFRFRHQLFQQYLYLTLGEAERAYLHEDVGRALEAYVGLDGEEGAARLAWHFERAGVSDKALDYLIQAGRQAARLGANDRVIEFCARSLNLLKKLPDSEQTAQKELILQIMLGNAYVTTRGYASPEAGTAFTLAEGLYRRVGKSKQLSQILFGLWGYYIHRGEYVLALELGKQALISAEKQQKAESLMNAHRLLGVSLFFMGDFISSLSHMEQVIEVYDPKQHKGLGFMYGSDPGLSAFSFAALDLVLMGYAEQSLNYSEQAIQIARELSYPFALAFALLHVLWLNTMRIYPQAVLDQVQEQIEVTTKYGYPMHLGMSNYYKYWAQGMLGEGKKARQRMQQAMDEWARTGSQLGKTAVIGGFAQVCLVEGLLEDGLSNSAAAIELCEITGEKFYQPDQFRIRGELLLEKKGSAHEVEVLFQDSIKLARQQKARLPELRAATSLCRLWQKEARKEEARQFLSEIYGWFKEGFDEPALREARCLLDSLSS